MDRPGAVLVGQGDQARLDVHKLEATIARALESEARYDRENDAKLVQMSGRLSVAEEEGGGGEGGGGGESQKKKEKKADRKGQNK